MENMTKKEINRPIAIKMCGVKKRYRLGQIGGRTLRADLQSWWARVRKKEDPNVRIGVDQRLIGQTFMALNGIDLTIYQGEAIGIIGGNGAGKSTMLKLLSRVTAPTEGEIDIYGRVASMLEVGTGFNGEMTGRENVYLNGAILGMSKAEIDAKMEEIIEFSEVRDFIDTPVKRYSSGMYVKLAFSVAAHLNSEIMIMDEVLAVGDMAFQKKCLTKMRDAAKQDGRTVLYVSHNMATIRQLCDRCIVLNQGKVVFEGDVESAIAIYYGNNDNELPVCYDLKKTSRPSGQHGHAIHINNFEFLGKERATFLASEPIRFSVNFTAGKDIDDLQMYLTIISDTDMLVGMTQSLAMGTNVKKGETYTKEYEIDLSNLCGGTYHFALDYFSGDGEGHHWSYDHPSQFIFFEITDEGDDGRLKWNRRSYGNVKLNPIIEVKN